MKNIDEEQVLKARMQGIKEDMEMIEAQKKKLDSQKMLLVMKLIAQREQLLSLQEQDE
jgi:hypothetical protein